MGAEMARLTMMLMALVAPIAFGAQAVSSLSREVQQYVSVPEGSVALTNVRVVDGTG